MPVSLTAPTAAAAGVPFSASVEVTGAPAGETITATLRAEDDPSMAPLQASGKASPSGEARLLFNSVLLKDPGSRALVATAKDGLGLPLGTDVHFVQVG